VNQNLNYLPACPVGRFVYCTFVPAENLLNAQPMPMRGRCVQAERSKRPIKKSDKEASETPKKNRLKKTRNNGQKF
jgi:hypothetical protein